MALKIDFITHDPKASEYVLYLVETGDWAPLGNRLKQIQERLYDAFDFSVDGHLAKLKPETKGGNIRIQVDAHDDPPAEVRDLVNRLSLHFSESEEYRKTAESSEFIGRLRVAYKVL